VAGILFLGVYPGPLYRIAQAAISSLPG